jgi:chromosome segregation ATPase
MSKLDALTRRVEKLESDNAGLVSENAQLKQSNNAALGDRGRQFAPIPSLRKRLRTRRRKVAALEKNDQATDWASRIRGKGDVRYRHRAGSAGGIG